METIKRTLEDSIRLKQGLLEDVELLERVKKVAMICVEALRSDKKILFCGNGGSAADAQHLAAELSGRFYYDRPPLFAEALHVNTSYLTAVGNDYGYHKTFSRLLAAKGRKGDVLIGLSTSGNSENILDAFKYAQENQIITVGISGETGGKMKEFSDFLINVASKDTPRIQEAHITLGHALCEIIEKEMFPR
jgi:D-sedoheptulose 7-phosphate isomerase